MDNMILINQIGFFYYQDAIRWKKAEEKNPSEKYKNCKLILKKDKDKPNGCEAMIEIWKEI